VSDLGARSLSLPVDTVTKSLKGDTLSLKSLDWKQQIFGQTRILSDAFNNFRRDNGFLLSSGLTFSILICVIPIVALLSVLIGTYLYDDREVIRHMRHYFEHVFPSDTELMRDIMRIIRNRKLAGVLGIGGLIWTSTWVFSSLRTILNIVFRVERTRGRVQGMVIDLLMIFVSGIFLMASMGLTSMIAYLQGHSFPSLLDVKPLLEVSLRYLIPFFFTLWMFFWVYKVIPNRKIDFKPALQAALFASVLWEVAKQLFGWYVLHLARFSMVYGSLGSLAILFFWIYYSSVILILGGEVAFLLEKGRNLINDQRK
jgi:membrane protein